MGRNKQVKVEEKAGYRPLENKFTPKSTINLNDLLTKRESEKRTDKKINFIILSGATTVTVIIISLLLF